MLSDMVLRNGSMCRVAKGISGLVRPLTATDVSAKYRFKIKNSRTIGDASISVISPRRGKKQTK